MNFEDETTREGFVIDNDQKAEWAIKAIREHAAERDRLVAVCEAEIDRLEGEIADANRAYESATNGLKFMLGEYACRTKGGRETKTTRTYKLPSGKLVWHKSKVDYERDGDKLLAWCTINHPDLVKITIKKEPMWAEIKKLIDTTDGNAAVTADGEIIDGVTVINAPERFEIQ